MSLARPGRLPPGPEVNETGILLLGAGLIGRRHLELISAAPDCHLAGIVETSPAVREALRAAGAPLFASLTEALSKLPQKQLGAIVATPNQLHVRQALQCIDAGVPTLVEKPLADTVADAEQLVAAAEAAHVPLLVGHHRRHSAYIAAARRILDSGVLGTVTAVTASVLFYKPDSYFAAAPWRLQPGGGPILINLIHEIDVLRALCGEVETVQAMSSSVARGFAVEDTSVVTLRFSSGTLGSISLSDVAVSSRCWELTARENPDYPYVPGMDCYVVAGTSGSLSLPTMRLETYQGDKSWWVPLHVATEHVDVVSPHARQLANFCGVIRGTEAPLVPGAEGLETLRVTLAVAEAARTGVAVRPGRPAT